MISHSSGISCLHMKNVSQIILRRNSTSVGMGVLYSVHFNSLGSHFSEVETEFSPLLRQIIPVACLPTFTHNFDSIYSVNSAKTLLSKTSGDVDDLSSSLRLYSSFLPGLLQNSPRKPIPQIFSNCVLLKLKDTVATF